MIDPNEARAFLRNQKNKQNAELAKRQFHNLQFLRHAKVTSAELTGLPTWDNFLEVLQGSVDNTRAHMALLAEKLTEANLTADSALTIRLEMVRCDERIKVLEHVMAVPSAIVAQGEEAEKLMGDENADS